MTIRHWDAPCKILSFSMEPNYESGEDIVRALIELADCYGDGSGKKGQRSSIFPNQLNADGGWKEIADAINNLIRDNNIKEKVMSAVEKSYEGKSIRELTDMYNSMVPEEKQVKKFKDKETAIKRMTEAFKNPVAASSGQAAAQSEKQPKVPAKLAKAATVVAQQFKLVGRKSNHAGKKIYKISKENPRREGSHGFNNWSIYRDGMTYEEFIMAKGGANHLNYDIEKGFVELK